MDVLAAPYYNVMSHDSKDPEWEERNRILLSVGQYAIALYVVLMEAGSAVAETTAGSAARDTSYSTAGFCHPTLAPRGFQRHEP